MARTVDDFLSRRTRLLLKNAKSSLEVAPIVAEIMANELGKDKDGLIIKLNNLQYQEIIL